MLKTPTTTAVKDILRSINFLEKQQQDGHQIEKEK